MTTIVTCSMLLSTLSRFEKVIYLTYVTSPLEIDAAPIKSVISLYFFGRSHLANIEFKISMGLDKKNSIKLCRNVSTQTNVCDSG